MFFKVNVQAAPPNYKGVVCSDSAGGGRNRAWHEGNLYQDANCHVGDTVRMSLSSIDIAKLTTWSVHHSLSRLLLTWNLPCVQIPFSWSEGTHGVATIPI